MWRSVSHKALPLLVSLEACHADLSVLAWKLPSSSSSVTVWSILLALPMMALFLTDNLLPLPSLYRAPGVCQWWLGDE